MASLVLGAGGAFVGNLILPGIGGPVGWAIGSAVGGLFGHPKTSPSTADKRVQVSSFGAARTILYGTDRIAGTIIFTTDYKESKKKVSGKGGPKTSVSTFTCSFAVALCKGPIVGVLRVWADGRLVWPTDNHDEFSFTLYLGDDTQLPDPTQEAILGTGNVPAYRGTAYAQFTDLPLAGYSNRIPNLTWEVQESGDTGLSIYSQWPVDYDFPSDGLPFSYPYSLNGVDSSVPNQLILHRYRSGNDYGAAMGTGDDNVVYYNTKTFDLHGAVLASPGGISYTVSAASTDKVTIYGSTNSGIAYARWNETIDCSLFNKGASTLAGKCAWFLNGAPTYLTEKNVLCSDDFCHQDPITHDWLVDLELFITSGPLYWNGFAYACGGKGTELWIRRWSAADGAVTVIDFHGYNDKQCDLRPYSHDGSTAAPFDIFLGDDGYLYCRVSYFSGGTPDPGVSGGFGVKLLRLDSDLNIVKAWINVNDAEKPFGYPGFSSAWVYRGYYIAYQSSGVVDVTHPCWVVYKLDDPPTYVGELRIPTPANDTGPVYSIGGGLAAYRGGILKFGAGGITLAYIVSKISGEVGYTSGQYDVSQLTDLVPGYKLGTMMTARAAIEALQPVYFFDAVESDDKIKYPKRGSTSIVSIPDDDLGAHAPGETLPGFIEGERLDELGLPMMVYVNYLNVNADYQDASQSAHRQATASQMVVQLQAPVVIDDAKASSVANTILYNSWLEREHYTIIVPRNYIQYEPTDVITAHGHVLRIVQKDESQKGTVKFDTVRTRSDIFIQAPTPVPATTYLPGGGSSGFVPQTPPGVATTDGYLADLPLVQDGDFTNGWYGGFANRLSGGWPGCELYRSLDGGVNYSELFQAIVPDSIGSATTVLADWTYGNVMDESNTVTVRLTPGSDTLDSTNDTGILNGANLCALGSTIAGYDSYELFQFRTATLIATSTYTLSGLLRGRRGSEWANSLHVIGDRFIMLPCHNIQGEYSELAQTRQYKAVSLGSALSTASAMDFTNNGIALKCYAPVQLGGGRNGAGDITLNWVRRTRIGGAWVDNVDAPLSEAFEQYTLVIFTDSTRATVKIAFAVDNAQTYTYTAAQQTSDFGGLQTTLYWNVAQNGAFGEGYEAQGTT